jgi:hypothetical protein
MLETMVSAGGGTVVKQLVSQFGLDADQVALSVSALLPAPAGGLQRKLSGSDVFGISNPITSGEFSGFVENPSSLAGPAALKPGKSQVSKIFGSGDLTKVAPTVAEETGVSGAIIGSTLPITATLLGGVFAKGAAAGDNPTDVVGQTASKGSGGLLGALKTVTQKMPGQSGAVVRSCEGSKRSFWSFAA